MWFTSTSQTSGLPFPLAVLTWNNWDDYGYKTTFNSTLWLSSSKSIDLGTIKILRFDQQSGPTSMPPQPVQELGPEYCSVGGDLKYYETLFNLGPAIYGPYLQGISDAAYSPHVRARFEDLEGYRVSRMRFSGAERTIADASLLFASSTPVARQAGDGFDFSFKTSLAPAANSFVIDFDFRRRGRLFNRMNVLIGYNGTGKTRLLSNLAIVASGYGYADKEAALERRSGTFVGTPPPFKTVVVVSYSAFDTFIIPGRTAEERIRLEMDGTIFGYVYCGLRERAPDSDTVDSAQATYRLRTPEETESEFISAVRRIREADRTADLVEVLRPLLLDASFLRIGFAGFYPEMRRDNDSALVGLFRSLSSGHKVVLKILTEMTAHMDGSQATLLLIDEPETHLHPPLLAAFLRSVRTCLERLDGYAIVSTHSPVVLQETPSQYVRVLRRVETQSRVDRPSMETFGENIGAITSEVFNLDDGSTDWHTTLKSLAESLTMEQIEEIISAPTRIRSEVVRRQPAKRAGK
jgi:predicted ATPase